MTAKTVEPSVAKCTINRAVKTAADEAKAIGCWVVPGRKDACLVGSVVLMAMGRYGKKNSEDIAEVAEGFIGEMMPASIREIGMSFDGEIEAAHMKAEGEDAYEAEVSVACTTLPPKVKKSLSQRLVKEMKKHYGTWGKFVKEVREYQDEYQGD